MTAFIFFFDEIDRQNLPEVGGKGANLGELARAGFNVPPGFCVTTAAFYRFMAEVGGDVYARLDDVSPDDLETLRDAGHTVRTTLAQSQLPTEVAQAVLKAWRALGETHAYAVRSSATAEDLPHASFAGQQDTYLNIRGEALLLASVKACFVSLFTDRAILYRIQNGFDHRQVGLSVVVQRMVAPDVSGILFTADPVTGRRHIASIDASFGLGEALVAGLVSADLYQVDKRTGEIVRRQIAAKKMAIRPIVEGGTIQVALAENEGKKAALSDVQVLELARVGGQIESHYGSPQDIEWAIAQDELFILQSRPITSLFPIPEAALRLAERTGQLQVMFSFGAVQGMLGPMTRLGQEAMQGVFAGAATLFGEDGYTIEDQPIIWQAAERLFVNVTALVRHPLGRRFARSAASVIEPGMAQAMNQLWDDPRLQVESGWFKFSTFRELARFFGPKIFRLVGTWRRPDQSRQALQRQLEQLVSDRAYEEAGCDTLGEQMTLLEDMLRTDFGRVFSAFLPVMAGGMSALNLLTRLVESLPGDEHDPLVFTRGLPHNVTTEMDLALWQTAELIRSDRSSRERLVSGDASDLAESFLLGKLPETAQQELASFLERYGMRGIGEIDLGRQRWRETPVPVIQVLQSYLEISDESMAPDITFARGVTEAEAAVEPLKQALRLTRFGWIKARLAGLAIDRVRALAGVRESPKFTVMRLYGILRDGLLASGRQLQAAGVIDEPEDLFHLSLAELKMLAAGREQEWRSLIADRKETYEREQRRTLIPRLLLSDGQALFDGLGADIPQDHDGLVGNPVSPGVVEGRVHVILNPAGARLAPGEILVCPGTDPAWTPLFLAAGGLVMEVGGLMTHGSVVAREYGIPAVVGVHEATRRLRTGQLIRVDGSSGAITLLESASPSTVSQQGQT